RSNRKLLVTSTSLLFVNSSEVFTLGKGAETKIEPLRLIQQNITKQKSRESQNLHLNWQKKGRKNSPLLIKQMFWKHHDSGGKLFKKWKKNSQRLLLIICLSIMLRCKSLKTLHNLMS